MYNIVNSTLSASWILQAGNLDAGSGNTMMEIVILVIAVGALALSAVNFRRISKLKHQLGVDVSNMRDDLDLSLEKVSKNIESQTKGLRKEVAKIRNASNPQQQAQKQIQHPAAKNEEVKDKPKQAEVAGETGETEVKRNPKKNNRRRPYKGKRKPAEEGSAPAAE